MNSIQQYIYIVNIDNNYFIPISYLKINQTFKERAKVLAYTSPTYNPDTLQYYNYST